MAVPKNAHREAGQGFKHHNPFFEGSAAALEAAMQENAHQNPDKSFEVNHPIAEGDLVAIHGHVHHKANHRGLVFPLDKIEHPF